MRPRLTLEAVTLHDAGWTQVAIAAKFGVCKTAVSTYLARRRAGTRVNQPAVEIQCARCGATVTKKACHVKGRIHSYCSDTCYQTRIKQHHYRQNRHGQRLARLEMARQFGPLPPGSVVHHRDGNCLNNAPANLVLFASQADHMRFHRHGHAVPLWPTPFLPANP